MACPGCLKRTYEGHGAQVAVLEGRERLRRLALLLGPRGRVQLPGQVPALLLRHLRRRQGSRCHSEQALLNWRDMPSQGPHPVHRKPYTSTWAVAAMYTRVTTACAVPGNALFDQQRAWVLSDAAGQLVSPAGVPQHGERGASSVHGCGLKSAGQKPSWSTTASAW